MTGLLNRNCPHSKKRSKFHLPDLFLKVVLICTARSAASRNDIESSFSIGQLSFGTWEKCRVWQRKKYSNEFDKVSKSRRNKNRIKSMNWKSCSKTQLLLRFECRERVHPYLFKILNVPFFSASAVCIPLSFHLTLNLWEVHYSIQDHASLLSSWHAFFCSWLSSRMTADDR